LGWPPWPPEDAKLLAQRYTTSIGIPWSPICCNAVIYGEHALEGWLIQLECTSRLNLAGGRI
jgi:hypothetical protein